MQRWCVLPYVPMLSISHAATGAFIATKVSNPLLSFPLILASHYVEDYVLHWDAGTGLSNGTRKRSHAFLLELIDLALAIVLVYLLFQQSIMAVNTHAWFGAFVGLLPDFLEAPRNFLHWTPWFLKPVNRFHHALHHSTPNVLLGLLPQVIVLLLIFFLR